MTRPFGPSVASSARSGSLGLRRPDTAPGLSLRSARHQNPHESPSGPRSRRARPDVTRSSALTTAIAALLLLVAGGAASADPDWHRLGDETADVLSDVLRIDTQNPPGGETAAANALARKLQAEGIPAEVFESA